LFLAHARFSHLPKQARTLATSFFSSNAGRSSSPSFLIAPDGRLRQWMIPKYKCQLCTMDPWVLISYPTDQQEILVQSMVTNYTSIVHLTRPITQSLQDSFSIYQTKESVNTPRFTSTRAEPSWRTRNQTVHCELHHTITVLDDQTCHVNHKPTSPCPQSSQSHDG